MPHNFLRDCAELSAWTTCWMRIPILAVYECDAFVIEKHCPSVAVFPQVDGGSRGRS